MTPADAKVKAQEVIDANASINSSYVANGGMAKAAAMASLAIDLATQLEAAQTELGTNKADHVNREKAAALAQREAADPARHGQGVDLAQRGKA